MGFMIISSIKFDGIWILDVCEDELNGSAYRAI